MTQPKALILADHLALKEGNTIAAAELRRLHEVNQELLNALHCISLAAQDSGSTREGMGLEARKAIAKAEGNNNG